MRKAIIALLVTASVALAFIQIDDTHVQTILTGAIKTFQDAIRFQATGGGTEYVGVVAPAVVNTPSVTYKLPQNDGLGGQALVTDGSANLSWAAVAGSTPNPSPTPLVFGTPGVIPVFASPELGSYGGSACPAPTPGNVNVVTSIDKFGAVTCGANLCPAGSDRTIQYNNSGSCAGDDEWTWQTGVSTAAAEIVTSRSGVQASYFVQNSSNTANSGERVWLRAGGASASGDTGIILDRGVAAGGVNEYLNMGVVNSSGNFNIIDGGTADMNTGTVLFQISRASGSVQTQITNGNGTSTVPGIAFVNNSGTGWSNTNPAGANTEIDTIAHNNLISHNTWLTGSSGVFGVDARFVLTPKVIHITGSQTAAAEVCDTGFLELDTDRGAGTEIHMDLTNSQEGQKCKIMNLGANDLTFPTTSGAGYNQITTGSVTQTLANEGDTIEFMSHLDSGTGAQRWYQSEGVQGP